MAVEAGVLFEAPAAVMGVDGRVVGSSAQGAAAEFELIGRLLRLGHRVAVPVVDDDGVDLIVDYATTVQVKTTAQRNVSGVPELKFKDGRRRQSGRPPPRLAPHVDVLAVLVSGVGWYFLPRHAVPPSGVVFGPRKEQWREAWDVFEGGRHAA